MFLIANQTPPKFRSNSFLPGRQLFTSVEEPPAVMSKRPSALQWTMILVWRPRPQVGILYLTSCGAILNGPAAIEISDQAKINNAKANTLFMPKFFIEPPMPMLIMLVCRRELIMRFKKNPWCRLMCNARKCAFLIGHFSTGLIEHIHFLYVLICQARNLMDLTSHFTTGLSSARDAQALLGAPIFLTM